MIIGKGMNYYGTEFTMYEVPSGTTVSAQVFNSSINQNQINYRGGAANLCCACF